MTREPNEKAANDYLGLTDEVNALDDQTCEHSFRDALKDLARMFHDLRMDFALFGALAVGAYVAERRSTRDIDVVISEQGAAQVSQSASDYGFSKTAGPHEGRGVLTFRHRNGAILDVICTSAGSADIEQAKTVHFAGVGGIPVATPEDLIWAKLRTQRSDWKRDPEKKLIDRSDIIALLRSNPEAFAEVQKRFDADRLLLSAPISEMAQALVELGHEAGIKDARPGALTGRSRGWLLVFGLGLLAALALLTAAVWLALQLAMSGYSG